MNERHQFPFKEDNINPDHSSCEIPDKSAELNALKRQLLDQIKLGIDQEQEGLELHMRIDELEKEVQSENSK